MTNALRIVAVCACLMLGLSSPDARAEGTPLDLTNTVWEGTDEEFSFSLTFIQGKAEGNKLLASLKGWGNETLELRGEFVGGTPDPRVRLVGDSKGETLTFDLRLKLGDQGEKPYFYGDVSAGAATYKISARCENRCPDVGPNSDGERATPATKSNDMAAHDLVGEWEDTSEEIGFKEFWSIKRVDGEWQVSGKFVKAEAVVGEFHGENAHFDSKTGTLLFLQVFDLKPDETWLASNDIEAAVVGGKLKFKVRGIDASLGRTPNTRK